MINYIIQVLIFQTLFLMMYDLFLKKETFFQWNRFYLIASSLVAYIIPLVKIKNFSYYVQQEFTLPTVVLNPKTIFFNEEVIGDYPLQSINFISMYVTLENLYFLGLLLMSMLFLFKIGQLISKIRSNRIIKNSDYSLVIIKNDTQAFSFFNYIFLGETIYNKGYKIVLKHELIHVKQRHSFDLLFFEIQKIVFWFNPFSYLFQRRISVLHEYIADEKNILKKDKKSFFESLLNETFNVENISFVNNYYKKSLLKKRIIMATKNKSKEFLKIKYLLILPILLFMFTYANAIKHKDENHNFNNNDNTNFVIQDSIFPFKTIERTPIFPGCENLITEDERKTCFTKSIFIHVSENFNAKPLQNIGLTSGRKRISVQFMIDKNGNIVNVKARAPHPKMQEEAVRTIKLLPKMEAGIQDGKNVSVRYNLPIVFKIDGENDAISSKNKENNLADVKVIPYAKIKETPIYPGCESLQDESKRKSCFISKITKHISDNFNAKSLQNVGLTSGSKRISVQFIIDQNGNIADIKTRAPHPKLQEEAIRTIKLLPQMKAGFQDGKKVAIRYNLPIVFEIKKP